MLYLFWCSDLHFPLLVINVCVYTNSRVSSCESSAKNNKRMKISRPKSIERKSKTNLRDKVRDEKISSKFSSN